MKGRSFFALFLGIIVSVYFGMGLAARNPFEPVYVPPMRKTGKPVSPRDYRLEQLTLKAVIWGTERSVALFEADDGQTFSVKMGAEIGKKGGKIIQIDDKIVIVQGPFGKKTFKLRGY